MRNTFANVFYEEAKKDSRLCVVVADISPAGSMEKLRREYPDRFINTGVAEQIMIGMCAGMAMRGLKPFAYTIATFALFRPYEFIRDDLAYQNLPVTVVGIGGGSALDVGKLIAFMAGQKRPVWDFEDIGDWWTRADADAIAPVVAIPTTAGTGSEVGRASVITHTESHEKKIIFHPKMMPRVVISDPELTVGLPPHVTVATGMDAFVHCFEAYCAPGFHPLADGIALEGMRLVKDYLPRAAENGADIEARAMMLAAASMGATAFQKGLGAVHALAHPVGATYDTHHGMTNAVILPYVIVFNKEAISGRVGAIARALDLGDQSHGGFLAWVVDFRRRLKVPATLRELGVGEDKAEAIGAAAAADPSAGSNPRPVTAADCERIFRAAVKGDLTLSP